MSDFISVGTHIHAPPIKAEAGLTTGAPLKLSFFQGGGYIEVTMFCESFPLSVDLANAINGVIKQHAPAPAEETA